MLNVEITTPYKYKVRKLEFSNHETESSSKESTKHSKEKYKDPSESGDSNKKKKKYKPYDEFTREFKNMKTIMFNGEVKKGEEA